MRSSAQVPVGSYSILQPPLQTEGTSAALFLLARWGEKKTKHGNGVVMTPSLWLKVTCTHVCSLCCAVPHSVDLPGQHRPRTSWIMQDGHTLHSMCLLSFVASCFCWSCLLFIWSHSSRIWSYKAVQEGSVVKLRWICRCFFFLNCCFSQVKCEGVQTKTPALQNCLSADFYYPLYPGTLQRIDAKALTVNLLVSRVFCVVFMLFAVMGGSLEAGMPT